MILAITITVDTIWATRNNMVHEGRNLNLGELVRSIRRRYHAHCVAWTHCDSPVLHNWSPPSQGVFKINYDAALRDNRICIAVVCRNWKGEGIQARLNRLAGVVPIEGEARAARLACSLAEELGLQNLALEGEAQALVTRVVHTDMVPDWIIEAEVLTMRAMLKSHGQWTFRWIPRVGNDMAYALARWG